MAEKKKSRRQANSIASDTLTPKQEKFCQYYVDTGYASEAYRMAYNTENMSYDSICQCASRMLNDLKITSRVAEIKRENEERSHVDRAKVEQVLMNIVGIDPAELYTQDEKTGKVRMKSPHQLPKRIRDGLQHITNNRGVIRYGFAGKTEAARLLGSWHGWDAPQQINVTGNITQEIRIGFDEEEDNA